MIGLTLDAGALIGAERHGREISLILDRARQLDAAITVPATVLAQVIRHPERQVTLARLLRQSTTTVAQLDRVDATLVGRLLAASGSSDITDAHVVTTAARLNQTVVTSDPDDIARLAPHLRIINI